MSAFNIMVGVSASGTLPVVSPSSVDVFFTRATAGLCYARIEFRNTGVEYNNVDGSNSAMATSRGNWLDSGAASGVWIQRVLDSGTLTTDPGSGRLQLSTSRLFDVRQFSVGSKSCTLTFNFYNAASGGTLLASQQITLTASHL